MARPKDDRRDLLVLAAAYLRAQYGMSQEEIGQALKHLVPARAGETRNPLSQSRVSRLLDRAKTRGWLQEILRFIRTSDVPAEQIDRIRSLLAPPELRRALEQVDSTTGVRVRHVTVLHSGIPGGPSAKQVDEALAKFGRMAAGRVEELIRGADVFAVTWGRTIGSVIDNLSSLRFQDDPRTVLFVPVCAEPVLGTRFSSSRLVDQLNGIVNHGRGETLSLSGVLEFIPRKFRGEKAEVIDEFNRWTPAYQRIFKADEPLVARLDALLTSTGFAERPLGRRNTGLLRAGEITADELRALVVGDLGGVLIPRPGLSAVERRTVDELNDMWTGITLGHIETIARRAAEPPGRPGIIVVSIDRQKAEIVAEIVRLGLVNELLIDEDLAGELVRVLTPP